MESFLEAFGGTLEEEVEDTINSKEETFYLWTTNEVCFNIYKIARNYLGEFYKLDTLVIVELAKAANADITKILHDIIYIHSGYLDIIVETPEPSDD
jgi:hypothetical protein